MQIRFESQTKHGVFKDALNLADDHAFSVAEIEAMKAARVAAWVDMVDNPPPPPVEPEPAVGEPTLIVE